MHNSQLVHEHNVKFIWASSHICMYTFKSTLKFLQYLYTYSIIPMCVYHLVTVNTSITFYTLYYLKGPILWKCVVYLATPLAMSLAMPLATPLTTPLAMPLACPLPHPSQFVCVGLPVGCDWALSWSCHLVCPRPAPLHSVRVWAVQG